MSGIIHQGIPMSAYLQLPAASAGLLKTLVDKCPHAAWASSWLNPDREADHGDASDLGTIVHSLLLEGDDEGVEVIQPTDYPSKTGSIPKGWTNNDIRQARDIARGAGRIPVLPEDMEKAQAVVTSAELFIRSLKTTEPAVWAMFQPLGSEAESVITWVDDIGGTPCKIRPDLLATDRKLIVDLKTTATSANPATWARTQMTGQSAYVSSAFYRRGVTALCGESPAYVFLVVETTPPYLCSLIGTDPHGFELGQEKVLAGLDLWSQCMKRQSWPAYPNRVCYPELPVYVDYGWQEQQGGIEYSLEQLHGSKTT